MLPWDTILDTSERPKNYTKSLNPPQILPVVKASEGEGNFRVLLQTYVKRYILDGFLCKNILFLKENNSNYILSIIDLTVKKFWNFNINDFLRTQA